MDTPPKNLNKNRCRSTILRYQCQPNIAVLGASHIIHC